jgi:spore photoproduct lyase
MMDKLIKTANQSERDLTFEIGSNSDLILENTITKNLEWTIERFGKNEKGFITFPTKFHMVEPLLPLNHKGRTIMRMSVNPEPIIKKVEFGTSKLGDRIKALNQMCEAGYKVGVLIAPVVLLENWREMYSELIQQLADEISDRAKKQLFIEIIFMTYSFVHHAINQEAFPEAVQLYDKSLMTGRGRGKYRYMSQIRAEGEEFLRAQISAYLPDIPIVYVV